ncbi:unnamed protein product [Rotaria magnacalcarata]|uniref:SARAH domain-containing protein n=2 Tax=Rotaria magnacalcarata TaxID=392030 RepID=A0A816LVW8_9BILA|nr:unnamed protein product [Rotaria magnacalcarata]CAF2167168.1 unnamed protein product [Rotaria magnacalcarata]CAF4058447.1 unnamed protein product [Rotaria magnacalcarata]CAF4125154.1 unnamed protein product [Rotaria magnacalcarata]
MPKKKEVSFQSNIPGKFIPRDDTPSASGFRSGTNKNRFNSKMVELLASSESSSSSMTSLPTPMNNENKHISNVTKPSTNDPTQLNSPEVTTIDSSRIHSRLFHRRIVTMLETLKIRSGNTDTASPSTSPKPLPSYIEPISQPITFGQLRQATTSSTSHQMHAPTMIEEIVSPRVLSARSHTNLTSTHTNADKESYHTNVKSLIIDAQSDLKPVASSVPINKSTSRHQANKERLYYSPSLEQLLEQHNVVPRVQQHDESKQEPKIQDHRYHHHHHQQQDSKSPLTVDEILATYYTKIKVSTTIETQPPPEETSVHSSNNNNMSFYMHPSPLIWNTSQTNQLLIPSSSAPPPLLLNEQSRNRPPPPSYSASVASGHRPPANSLGQHLFRPSAPSLIPKQMYNESQMTQNQLPVDSYGTLPTPLSSIMANVSVRPPPPSYELPTSNIERSHSAVSSMNRPNYSHINPPQAGFDREFSRLLYGKDGRRSRNQKRKAFSDPVKKSVEEAGQSMEKMHRRIKTHLNTTDTVNEEEESSNDSTDIDKREKYLRKQTRLQRQSDFPVSNRESAKQPIVPPNPLLKRPIPSFLQVYSQATASKDIILQWNLFSLSELESFDAMMTKLYRDENFVRVQLFENYRALLTLILESKKRYDRIHSDEDKDEDDSVITTTAL